MSPVQVVPFGKWCLAFQSPPASYTRIIGVEGYTPGPILLCRKHEGLLKMIFDNYGTFFHLSHPQCPAKDLIKCQSNTQEEHDKKTIV